MLRKLSAIFRQLSLFDPAADSPATVPEAPSQGSRSLRHMGEGKSPAAPALSSSPATPDSSSSGFADLCRGPYSHVRVEVGARLRNSWRVTWNRRFEAVCLRVPSALETAPREVKEAILRWAVLVSKRTRRREDGDTHHRMERRRLEGVIRDYLQGPRGGEGETSRHHARRLAANRRRLERLRPMGTWHDLEGCLARINAEYFDGTLKARITWAARLGGLSTHRIAEDGKGQPYHLLTISRGYDSPEVTPEILGGVVYHECLHIAVPPRKENGRRVVHGRDFRERERQYRHYREWQEWHREGLVRSLRRMMREERKGRTLP